ncbi:MAG: hypothetical protein U0795_15585 [Pirellulales bacterium]
MNLYEVTMNWVCANSAIQEVHRDVEVVLRRAMQEGRSCSFTLGGGLVRNQKPYLIYCFDGEFYAFQLTPRQAAQLRLGHDQMASATGNRRGLNQPGVDPVVTIVGVEVDRASALNRQLPITGNLLYQAQRPVFEPVAIRVECEQPARGSIQLRHYLLSLIQLNGTIRFSLPPMGSLPDQHGQEYSGVMPMFFQMWTAPEVSPAMPPELKRFGVKQDWEAPTSTVPFATLPAVPAGPSYPPTYDPGVTAPKAKAKAKPEPRPISDVRAILVEID